MDGYKSKVDKAWAKVNSQYPSDTYSECERQNVFKQIFAKLLVNGATIGCTIDENGNKTNYVVRPQTDKPKLP